MSKKRGRFSHNSCHKRVLTLGVQITPFLTWAPIHIPLHHFSPFLVFSTFIFCFLSFSLSLCTHLKVFNNNESLSHLWYISEIDFSADDPFGERDSSVNENWLSSLLPPSSSSSSPNPNLGCVSGCPDVFDYKNYHLTSLRLDGGSNLDKDLDQEPIICPYVQKPFFASLQQFKNLKTLNILHIGGISSDWLCLIPQNVTRLKVNCLNTFPTANQLSTLPPYLKYLSLSVEHKENALECDWTHEVLQSLPRSLYKLSIKPRRYSHLTQRMYEYLPPNLHSSTLVYKDLDSKATQIPPAFRPPVLNFGSLSSPLRT